MAQPATSSPSALPNANSLPASESQIAATNPKSYPSRPKDGARTLLDAVTAYQRRAARAERSAAHNQRPDGNSQAPRGGLPSSNHYKRASSPSSRNASTKVASTNHPTASSRTPDHPRRNQIDSEFSRNTPIRQTEPEAVGSPHKASDPRHLAAPVGRRSGSSPHYKKNTPLRSSMVSLSAAGNHGAKLFDPNAKTLPISKLHNEKNRVNSLAKSSRTTNSAKAREVEANEHGDDQDSSQSNPSHGSLVASKAQGPPPPIRGYDSQERGWKSKKVPVRGSVGEPRQLFDPRKHDPVKFAASKRTSETGPKMPLGSMPNGDTLSASLHANQEHEQRDLAYAPEDETRPSSLVANLKQAYKRIVRLETALRDEEHAAKAKDEELKAREIRESQNHSHPTASSSSALLRIHAQQKRTEEDYWVRLAKQHRELAEAHHLFLEMALDPRLPASMHALPQKYNTPTRLWQTGFHQLLERLRHALPQLSSSANVDQTNQPLLEHMTDFIYFAYGFYTTLLEEQRLLPFKSVWIEQLGDLARYRMAVAGLMSKFAGFKHGRSEAVKHPVVTAKTMAYVEDDEDDESDHDVSRRSKLRSRRHPRDKEADSTSLADGPASQLSLSSEESHSNHKPIPVPRRPVPPNADGSIGLAALGDWEFEEQETWRATAKDWYSKGLADNPGTGRLHHHLALLSKGDELRTLYHYCKSLTAAHPYIPARESILPFFEQEHQARRSRPEVSISDLFVNLHGMLFTKIQLDDFDSELARFIEKLAEDRLLSEKQDRANHEFDRRSNVVVAQPTMSDASWVMMGTINISALLQYGAEDGVIRVAQQNRHKLSQDSQQRHLAGKGLSKGLNGTSKSAPIAPQAILLNHQPPASMLMEKSTDTRLRRSSQSGSSEEGLSSPADNCAGGLSPFVQSDHPPAANVDPTGSKNVLNDEQCKAIMIKIPDAEENDEEGGPIVFTLAAKFTFEMLKDVLQRVDSVKVCPYVTMILTFLGSMCQNGRVMKKLERFIPWDQVAVLFNRIPSFLAFRIPSSSQEMAYQGGGPTSFRLVNPPLLEDWCLRGMEWTGKRLFPKGYWKFNKGSAGTAAVDDLAEPVNTLFNLLPGNWNIESEMDVLSGLSGGLEVGCREREEELQTQESNMPIDHGYPSTFCQYRIDMCEDANDLGDVSEGRNDRGKGRGKSEPRWERVALVAGWVSKSVLGFGCEANPNSPEQFAISKALRQKIRRWEVEAKREENEQRMLKSQRTSRDKRIVAIDEEIDRREAEEEDDDDDDPGDSELVKSLKARRRELKALLNQTKKISAQGPATVAPRQARKSQAETKAHLPGTGHQHRPSKNASRLNALPGYTTLVFDTNILVGMLSIVKELLESEQFTIIIPLVVITELDGLKKRAHDQESQSRCLGQDALQAIKYLESSIKRYSRLLKIQTSKGNYLRDLSIRNEKITFLDHTPGTTDGGISTNAARNLDDVVLRATMWQLEHFSNRLGVSDSPAEEDKPEKVVLVTLDRNLRLKARARGIVAADEKEIIGLVDSTKAKARTNVKG